MAQIKESTSDEHCVSFSFCFQSARSDSSSCRVCFDSFFFFISCLLISFHFVHLGLQATCFERLYSSLESSRRQISRVRFALIEKSLQQSRARHTDSLCSSLHPFTPHIERDPYHHYLQFPILHCTTSCEPRVRPALPAGQWGLTARPKPLTP